MEPVIETQNLSKYYGKFAALDDLNLTLNKGEILGYLGPNGAGKTTTIRLLLGLIHPTVGSAKIFGLDAQKDLRKIHSRVAFVPGEANLWPNLTGRETLELLAKTHGNLDAKYRADLLRKFDFDPDKKVRNYSKGNRQKITLIAALASRAELLILDEPTAGLDPLMEKVFRDEIRVAKNNGQTVFLSSHILSEVEILCDRVAVLRKGKLVESGTLDELRHLSAVTVEATFAGAPPDVAGAKNVSEIHVHGQTLSCQVRGSIDDLLAKITPAKPLTLLSREPSLEELFLSLYGEDDDAK